MPHANLKTIYVTVEDHEELRRLAYVGRCIGRGRNMLLPDAGRPPHAGTARRRRLRRRGAGGRGDPMNETELVQQSSGFAAHIRGTEFSPVQPVAWQTGWLDANELGELAPLVWLRMEAEA